MAEVGDPKGIGRPGANGSPRGNLFSRVLLWIRGPRKPESSATPLVRADRTTLSRAANLLADGSAAPDVFHQALGGDFRPQLHRAAAQVARDYSRVHLAIDRSEAFSRAGSPSAAPGTALSDADVQAPLADLLAPVTQRLSRSAQTTPLLVSTARVLETEMSRWPAEEVSELRAELSQAWDEATTPASQVAELPSLGGTEEALERVLTRLPAAAVEDDRTARGPEQPSSLYPPGGPVLPRTLDGSEALVLRRAEEAAQEARRARALAERSDRRDRAPSLGLVVTLGGAAAAVLAGILLARCGG